VFFVLGNCNIMDDANVPSLLSLPYLNVSALRIPEMPKIYKHTRELVLSPRNPWFFNFPSGVGGIGSPHTGKQKIWPMSWIMQGITSILLHQSGEQSEEETKTEVNELISALSRTTANTFFMHESFLTSSPEHYSRSWFAWANSLFAELVLAALPVLVQ
jgi:meiotically up-regulated gene 157 (Mug157) protein